MTAATWTGGRRPGDARRRRRPRDIALRGLRRRHGHRDGYFVVRALRGVDLRDPAAVATALAAYEDPRRDHTTFQVRMAYMNGQMFHHTPRVLQPLRDLVFDHTPFLQKVVGDTTPARSTSSSR